jgi:hypothetical protein
MKHISTFSENNKTRTSFWVYTFIIIIGIALGSLMIKNKGLADSILINLFFKSANNGISVLELVIGDFISALIFTLSAFFFGLCVLGAPFDVLLLLCRGAGMGASVAFIYSCADKASFGLLLITILPKAVVFSIMAVVTVRESLSYSRNIFMYCIKAENYSGHLQSFRFYCIKFIVLIFLSLIISAVDGGLNYLYNSIIRH